jgi:hypothetical protein
LESVFDELLEGWGVLFDFPDPFVWLFAAIFYVVAKTNSFLFTFEDWRVITKNGYSYSPLSFPFLFLLTKKQQKH